MSYKGVIEKVRPVLKLMETADFIWVKSSHLNFYRKIQLYCENRSGGFALYTRIGVTLSEMRIRATGSKGQGWRLSRLTRFNRSNGLFTDFCHARISFSVSPNRPAPTQREEPR